MRVETTCMDMKMELVPQVRLVSCDGSVTVSLLIDSCCKLFAYEIGAHVR